MAAAFIRNIIYEHAFSGAPCYRLGEQTWSLTLGHPQLDEETGECPGLALLNTVTTHPVWLLSTQMWLFQVHMSCKGKIRTEF